ncbi:MAG: hypothetical protein GY854_01705 [Deltaproteobacteria bacterium]|nr:hypothetical protein [Deltaproteobacteria bacterium]
MVDCKRLFLVACIGLVLIGPTACWFTDTGGGFVEWSEEESGVTADLHGIWGVSVEDIWAVGDSGTIIHFDGVTWSSADSATSADLTDVWGTADNNVWAVGGYDENKGVILHYNGERWSEIINQVGQKLFAIWGSKATDIWTLGGADQKTLLLHFNGSSWQMVNVPGSMTLGRDIWGDGFGNVFVTTAGNVAKYDGASWTILDEGFEAARPAFTVWGASTDNLYVAGSNSIVRHWDGSKWSNSLQFNLETGFDLQFHSIWGSSADNLFAVGVLMGTTEEKPYKSYVAGTRIYYSNGKGWTRHQTADIDTALYDVWGASDSEIWAVGQSGKILSFW